MTRCDQCFLIGKRAARLSPEQAALAWDHLAAYLRDEAGGLPLPKFKHLTKAIRAATIAACKNPVDRPESPVRFSP